MLRVRTALVLPICALTAIVAAHSISLRAAGSDEMRALSVRRASLESADAIRKIGPEFCILSSDLGQKDNPLPAPGFGPSGTWSLEPEA